MPALNEESLYRPFIAEDDLEYEDFAAFLCGRPQDTWRNQRIQDHRKAGRSELSGIEIAFRAHAAAAGPDFEITRRAQRALGPQDPRSQQGTG